MPELCFIDTETYSDADLRRTGHAKYFEHSSTRTLIVTYNLGGKTRVWDLTVSDKLPKDLARAAADPDVTFLAFNAPFDRQALTKAGIHVPLDRWRCLQVAALALGFNGSLDAVLNRFDIPYQKERDGARLIRKFCCSQPANRKIQFWDRHNAPTDWKQFIQYAITDTDVLVPLYEKLSACGHRVNWNHWQLDQRMNMRGIPVDMELVQAALLAADQERETLLTEMQRITHLENPNSSPQLKVWLRDNGLSVPNMQKATLALAMTNTKNSVAVQRALVLKSRLAKTSTSKWDAFSRTVCADSTLKYAHQYLGAARTGRDAHRLVQPGNFPRGNIKYTEAAASMLISAGREGLALVYEDVMDALSSLIRAAITAPNGKQIIAADLVSIEGSVLPWLCEFDEKLQQIRDGKKMYLVAAASIYNKPYESLTKKSPEYMPGKVAELALGYGGGAGETGALVTMGGAYGVTFTQTQRTRIVNKWRETNKPIVDYWADCQDAVRLAIRNPGKVKRVKKVRFSVIGDFLYIILPSGRRLAYYKPEYNDNQFSYMGLDTYTRKWERTLSFGGKIVENITQAVSYDVFFHGLEDFVLMGGDPVLRVHDEIAAIADDSVAVSMLDTLIHSMEEVPEWAEGLPLKADGFIAKRYRK